MVPFVSILLTADVSFTSMALPLSRMLRFGSGDFDSFVRIDAKAAREYAAKFLALKENRDT